MRFVSPEGMREADRATIAGGTAGLDLMEAAGAGVAEETWSEFPHRDWRLVVLCGTGNNGGDGFVAARELRGRYARVDVLVVADRARLHGDALRAAEAYEADGGTIEPVARGRDLARALGKADLLIDAVLGTGTRGDLREPERELLDAAVAFRGRVVAVDCPSGLDTKTGALLGPVVPADVTVTFGAAKLGHVLGDGPDVTGRVVVREIGLSPDAVSGALQRPDAGRSLEPDEVEALLPLPTRRGHKRDNGVLAIVAGSATYSGAAVLTADGAIRGGVGLGYALVPPAVKSALSVARPEVIGLAIGAAPDGALAIDQVADVERGLLVARPDAIVMGPGLGSAPGTAELVRKIAAGLEDGSQLLLDADGVTAFAGRLDELRALARRLRLSLTPHPGELGRLLDLPGRQVDVERMDVGRRFADDVGCALLLKGAPSLIFAPGRTTVVNLTGNEALAKGGTGDLLSGLAGAFLSKEMDPMDALSLAAFVHGLAADVGRARLGTLALSATGVARHVPHVLAAIERRQTTRLLRWSNGYRRLGAGPLAQLPAAQSGGHSASGVGT